MKKLSGFLLTALLVTTFCFAQKKDEKAIRKVFDKYREAILNDKGEEALNYVDSRTLKYYDDILEHIKKDDSLKIEHLSLMDKTMVLMVRQRVPAEKILAFDGRSLFVFAIEKGMVGKSGVARNNIGEIGIEGDFAKAQFVADGQKTPLNFHFYKESGKWRLDLTSVFSFSNIAFKQMIKESKKTENEFLFEILEMATGEKPGREVWEPLE